MFLGEVFKENRLKLQINQVDLAHGICTQTVISKMENQNIPPSSEILIKLCQRVNLTLNDVFSEFSKIPSKNLIEDKLRDIDNFIQTKNFAAANELIHSVSQDNLTSSQVAHLHFQLGKVSIPARDLDEAIFQFNYVLQVIDNRKIIFWKILAYSGLAHCYLIQNSDDKVNYYAGLAFKMIEQFKLEDQWNFGYYLESINSLATYYVSKNDSESANKLIQIGLQPHHGYLSTTFSDNLYYLSAFLKSNDTAMNKNDLSRDLTMAIAFADYNKNQQLLDQVNRFMQANNITELKIKP
jgi:DNA-binding XRE family transcriptional regulator